MDQVTNRLNRMARSKDAAKREQLRVEAAECVDYLYDAGRRLSRKIDRARNTLSD